MLDLPELNRLIQLEVGTDPDRKWGPVTAAAVLAKLRALKGAPAAVVEKRRGQCRHSDTA